jgi:hypothetical protein
MALREYEYNGGTYQFDEKLAPKGAKLIDSKQRAPQNKQKAPANKAARPTQK